MNDHKQERSELLAHDPESAARILGIGKTKLYQEINAGRIAAKKVGRRTIIPVQALHNWIEKLENFN